MTHRAFLPATLLLAPFMLAGCGAQAGGQTGEETDGLCVFATTALSLGAPSPLGFTAEQVLAFAEGEHVTSFDWQQEASLPYAPEGGRGMLTAKVLAAGSAQFARVEPAQSAMECRDHVRIPIDVELFTAGGAFDESFPAALVAVDADQALVRRVLQSTDVQGAFSFAPGVLGERRFVRIEIDLGFRPTEFAGSLLAGIESGGAGADGSASLQVLPLACWGRAPGLPFLCTD